MPEIDLSLRPHTGPWAKYADGLQKGELRPDERQVAAMKLLQRLFVDLQRLYPPSRKGKPSNLAVLDSVAPSHSQSSSWCALSVSSHSKVEAHAVP